MSISQAIYTQYCSVYQTSQMSANLHCVSIHQTTYVTGPAKIDQVDTQNLTTFSHLLHHN